MDDDDLVLDAMRTCRKAVGRLGQIQRIATFEALVKASDLDMRLPRKPTKSKHGTGQVGWEEGAKIAKKALVKCRAAVADLPPNLLERVHRGLMAWVFHVDDSAQSGLAGQPPSWVE